MMIVWAIILDQIQLRPNTAVNRRTKNLNGALNGAAVSGARSQVEISLLSPLLRLTSAFMQANMSQPHSAQNAPSNIKIVGASANGCASRLASKRCGL